MISFMVEYDYLFIGERERETHTHTHTFEAEDFLGSVGSLRSAAITL